MTISLVAIEQLQVEHHESGFAISHAAPRLSWRFGATSIKDWKQSSWEIIVTRNGKEERYTGNGEQSTLVAWPSAPLASRERASVRVRAFGPDGTATEWASADVEAGLLNANDWQAQLISAPASIQPIDGPKKPFRLVRSFDLDTVPKVARIYATAHGVYTLEINGKAVGDQVLMPGFQTYAHRLAYQTFDVAPYLHQGKNEIVIYVGEAWFSGRLWTRQCRRNTFGVRNGAMLQLELDGKVALKTDESWEWGQGQVVNSELFDGETVDTNASNVIKGPAEVIDPPTGELVSLDAPPVRRIMEIKPVDIITTPSGKKIIDFGQNLVGWVRIERQFDGPGELIMRHAEVLEHGELGVRPLRTAKATDRIVLGGNTKGWEPKFTFHGFRYAEVSGVDFTLADFTAVVISSDMRRTGTFESSHEAINRLHENVVWGMRGNFVSVPTDCPQRDERMGWTGDIQVFAPTANFLYDTAGFLGGWLRDLEADQRANGGVVPVVIPHVPFPAENGVEREVAPHAVWGDVAVLTPNDLFTSFGDDKVLETQWESMKLWLDSGIPRDSEGLWDPNAPQFADWLDPRAPPQYPAHGMSDTHMVANAYLVHTTRVTAAIGERLGKPEAAHYRAQAEDLHAKFLAEYVSPNGRTVSDTQTALALAIHFKLLEGPQIAAAIKRLEFKIRWDAFKISTGFAGTPIILNALADAGLLHLAYRMLQERDNPSWLYSVLMGATTIWERWDSMLPDGTINPGQMTSFNHYALGSVATFMHQYIGGLSPELPGYKRARIAPQPGGTVTSAKVSYSSVYGMFAVDWVLEDGKLKVKATVPPNAEGHVVLPAPAGAKGGVDVVVGSGEHSFEVDFAADARWPPSVQPGPQSMQMEDEFIA